MNYVPFIAAAILLAGGLSAGGGAVYLYVQDGDDTISGDYEGQLLSAEIDYEVEYVTYAGEVVQFRSSVSGGNPPFTYDWTWDLTGLWSQESDPFYYIPEYWAGQTVELLLTVTDFEDAQVTDSITLEIGPVRSMTHTTTVAYGNEFPGGDDWNHPSDEWLDLGQNIAIFAFPRVDGPPPVEVQFTLAGALFLNMGFFWDFDDGESGWYGSTTVHVFEQPGNYNVTYSFRSPNENYSELIELGSAGIIVLDDDPNPEPTFDIDIPQFPDREGHQVDILDIYAAPPQGIAPLYVYFNTNMAPAVTTGFLWSFGDGSALSFDRATSHVFVEPGTYHVTVTYTPAGYGPYAYGEIDIIVERPPGEDFEIDIEVIPTNFPLEFIFEAHPSIEEELTFEWSFDFSPNITGNPVTHMFARFGLRSVHVHAYNDELGISANASVELYVSSEDAPTVHFLVHVDPFEPGIVSFEPVVSGQPPYRYSWLFGDGTGSSDPALTHYYGEYGYYKVELYVIDQNSVGYYSDWIFIRSPYIVGIE